jgi:hypothetical protein
MTVKIKDVRAYTSNLQLRLNDVERLLKIHATLCAGDPSLDAQILDARNQYIAAVALALPTVSDTAVEL